MPRKRATAKTPPSVEFDETQLHEWALRHLNRYDASVQGLRTTVLRKVRSNLAKSDLDEVERQRRLSEARGVLDRLLERFQGSGLLDDGRLAGHLVGLWREHGLSARAIRARLIAKGFATGVVEASLQITGDPRSKISAEADAAVAFARRRRLGCFSGRPRDRAADRRDLARMARAGFDYDVAVAALNVRVDDDTF